VTSFDEALEDAVAALRGYQRAAAEVWPTESPIDRGRHLRACLDPERREKLAPLEIAVLMRAAARVGCLTPLAWLAEECGCRAPEPVSRADVEGALAREIAAATAALSEALQRAERLSGRVVPMEGRR